jgi:uncharacterized protein
MSEIDLLAPPDDRAVAAALKGFSEATRKRYGPKLAGLHLFGSRARGDFKPLSDVDVAVILVREDSKTLDEQIALYDLAYDLLLETGAEIQPWLFDAHEWADPSHSATGDLVRSAKGDSRALWVPS